MLERESGVNLKYLAKGLLQEVTMLLLWLEISCLYLEGLMERLTSMICTRSILVGILHREYSTHLDADTWAWSRPAMKGTPPSPRADLSACIVGKSVYFTGGKNQSMYRSA